MHTITKITLSLIIFINYSIFCQNGKKITITVKDQNMKPLAGVLILFDDVRQERWTNKKGEFKTKIKKGIKKITAYYPKIGLTDFSYNNEEKINIIIKESFNNDIEIANKHDNSSSFKNIYDFMRGKVTGVSISNNERIVIRGVNTINGSTTPLFVLNGSPITQSVFGNINPGNIKLIKVLKGPETASYGIRGANGVIEVYTH